MTPEEIFARVLYRDGLILVVDKPAGLAVHRGPKGGENLEESFIHLRYGLPRSPALAHRLDKDTSGCLVLGRHRKALEKLMLLFKQGKISKTYWAVVEGGPLDAEGLIDLPLGQLDAARGWWMKVDPKGQPAQTRWRVRGRGHDAAGKPIAWLELSPLTGRTHQLRVHCAALDFPIHGDPIYGPGATCCICWRAPSPSRCRKTSRRSKWRPAFRRIWPICLAAVVLLPNLTRRCSRRATNGNKRRGKAPRSKKAKRSRAEVAWT